MKGQFHTTDSSTSMSSSAPGLITTEDMQRAIEDYRRTKEVIEKIRYGQYL